MAFKSLLDPTFTYRNAANTNVRATFERVRREQQEARRQRECDAAKVIAIIGNTLQAAEAARSPGTDRRSVARLASEHRSFQ